MLKLIIHFKVEYCQNYWSLLPISLLFLSMVFSTESFGQCGSAGQQIKRPGASSASFIDFGPTSDAKLTFTFQFEGCNGNAVSAGSTVNVELVAAAANGTYNAGDVIASGTYNYGAQMLFNLQNNVNWNGTGTSAFPGGYWAGLITDGSTIVFDKIRWHRNGGMAGDIPVTFRFQLVDPQCCATPWIEMEYGIFYTTTADNRGPDTSNGTISGGYWTGPTWPIAPSLAWGLGSSVVVHENFLAGPPCGALYNNVVLVSPPTGWFINEVNIDGTWITLTSPAPLVDGGGGLGYVMPEMYIPLQGNTQFMGLFDNVFHVLGGAGFPGMTHCEHFHSNWSSFTTYNTRFLGYRIIDGSGVLMGEWECTDASIEFGG